MVGINCVRPPSTENKPSPSPDGATSPGVRGFKRSRKLISNEIILTVGDRRPRLCVILSFFFA